VDVHGLDSVVIDHWYESAFVNGGHVVQSDGKRTGKSRWKFWAGQHEEARIKKGRYVRSNKGIAGLVLDLVGAAAGVGTPNRLQDLLAYASPRGSGLNVDSATTRSSIDRGISANDAAASGLTAGRPILELLATIGLATFFPPRRYGTPLRTGRSG
jgi:CRISPR-associated protein Csb3